MPKIFLKPNSAEYADDEAKPKHKAHCEMPECSKDAEFKAPKDRSLNEYYHFCLEHVQEYNKAWDFFSGMSAQDIEDHIIRSAYWDRETHKFKDFKNFEEELKQKSWQSYNFSEEEPAKRAPEFPFAPNSPEVGALAIMGLAPPLTLKTLKARYKELAKKHHPDLNKGDPKSEEMLKNINMAYTILKIAYEKFEKYDEP